MPEEDYTIPFGVADVKREGSDVTIVAIGGMVGLALQAAEALSQEGVSAEVIDPRSLVPLDLGDHPGIGVQDGPVGDRGHGPQDL